MAERRPPGLCARRSCTPLMLFPRRQRASNPLDAQAEGLCSRNFMSSGVETPLIVPISDATGFLDFARNDRDDHRFLSRDCSMSMKL